MDTPRTYCVTVECLHTGSPTGEQLTAARRLLAQTGRYIAFSLDCRGAMIRFVCDLAASDELDACARALAGLRQVFAAPDVAWAHWVARTRADAIRITEQRTMVMTYQERGTVPENIVNQPQEYPQMVANAA